MLGRSLHRARRRLTDDPATAVTVAIVLLSLLYVLSNASAYGQSWDDPGDASFGQATLRAYAGETGYLESGDRKYYGPFYFMVAAAFSSALHGLFPGWQAVDARHFLNFICFLLAALAVYGIARRMMSRVPAGLAALAFLFQPVLFGHAFINQKDIPLLAGFTCSVFLGLRIGDTPEADRPGGPGFLPSLHRGWRSSSAVRRGLFVLAALLGLVAIGDLVFGGVLLGWGQRLLAAVYNQEALAPLNRLFSLAAQDAGKTPLAAYAGKLEAMFGWIRMVGVSMALTPAIVMAVAMARAGSFELHGTNLSIGRVVLAAIVLGLTLSIRVVGFFAGGLTSLAVLAKRGRAGVSSVLLYWAVAMCVMYLTWPYLWDAPVSRLLDAVRVMSDFPHHSVLFEGSVISSTRLPREYLPTLLAIQLTEPVLILVVIGLAGVPSVWHTSRDNRLLLIITLIWFLVPLAASVILRMPVYSNFRQVLFALPPLFLVAGIGIDLVWSRLPRPWWRAALVTALLLPGLAAIVRLRPYEYVYYNSFVGGEKGAEGRFPHDYWCTSYREAMAYVNGHAAPGSEVAVSEPLGAAATFARPDLTLVRRSEASRPTFVLRCNDRGDLTLRNLEEFPAALIVARSGVVLSVVLEPASEPAGGG